VDKSIIAALIALAGTLIVGFLSTFLAEHYRRFLDRTSLAGAIAGELASYNEAWPMLEKNLTQLFTMVSSGKQIKIPKIEQPTDRVFDSCVEKLGLLGPELAEDIAYVYNNLNAFRVALLAASEVELSGPLQAGLLQGALEALKRANDRGIQLLQKLKKFANENYFLKLPFLFGIIFLIVFFGALSIGVFSLSEGHQQNIIPAQKTQSALAIKK
jgi:hypothetical protein